MKWVTRRQIRINRAATAWLVRRFIDPAAEFTFVDRDEVAAVQQREGALGFDAPGARYPHQDDQGRCSFRGAAGLAAASALLYLGLSRTVEAPPAPRGARLTPASRRVLWRLSALFALDSVGGGFLTATLLAYFFHGRFGASAATVPRGAHRRRRRHPHRAHGRLGHRARLGRPPDDRRRAVVAARARGCAQDHL